MASAGLYLAALTGSLGGMVLAILTPLPLFLVGLSIGGKAATWTGGAATLVIGLASTSMGGALYLIAYAIPAAWLSDRASLSRRSEQNPTGQTLEWYPPGLLCTWLTVIPIVVALMTFIYSFMSDGGMEVLVTRLLEPFLRYYQSAYGAMLPGSEPLPPHQLEMIKALIVNVAPAMMAIGAMMTLFLNGILAQSLLVRFGRNRRPSPSMSEIELPRPVIVTFGACFLIGVTIGGSTSYLGTTLAGILAFPIFLSGLGVAHAVAASTKVRLGILFTVYIVLMISRWATPALVVLGLVDHFVGLKARMRNKSAGT